jgi:hypothetical protein
MPGRTSPWLFKHVHVKLEMLLAMNTEVLTPNQVSAPAATIQTLLNGAVRTTMPSRSRWLKAWDYDSEMIAIRNLILN